MRYSAEVIGKNIKTCREMLKPTDRSQEALGKKIGVTGKQISNYEKGKLIPPTDILFKLCEVFDCELGYLLGEEQYSQGTQLYTAISKEMGLNTDAVKSIIGIKSMEESRLNFEKHRYMNILNQLLQANKFIDLLQTISKLEKFYIKCNDQLKDKEKLPESLEQKYKKETLEKAWENWDVSEYDYNLPSFTTEEIEAINDVNSVIDDLYDADCAINKTKSDMKYCRFLIQETLTLLLQELYPIK